jgi:aldehyde dehydrogenase (NAD+)/betaine-aldehyde dehydrogenase
MTHTKSFIDGKSVDTEKAYENIDPSTGQAIGTVARGGEKEVDLAVQAAERAQSAWANTLPAKRAELLTGYASTILAHREELACMESEDTGKPLGQARADVDVCARYFQFYGHAIDTYYGQSIPFNPGFQAFTTREPFGVTGHVVAWNYPMQLLARGVAPAIASGNCSVVKPSSETPRTAVRLAELSVEAGIPGGVFNVVTGYGSEAGNALSAHPGIRQIGFVGSTEVGSTIAIAAGKRVVPVTLELGGKSAHVVFPDADLDSAALYITKGILQNAGQTCSAGSRLVVHRDVHDALLDRLMQKFAATSIGPGKADKDLGPLVSVRQQQRVADFVAGIKQGKVVFGGAIPDSRELAGGSYYLPTIVDGVDPHAPIAQQEIFGPVLAVIPFEKEEDAVCIANCTEFALMGAVWTSDLSRALRVSRAVVAGQVYINAFGAGGGVELPFGGFRQSGYGREKGIDGLNAYTQSKTVIIKI